MTSSAGMQQLAGVLRWQLSCVIVLAMVAGCSGPRHEPVDADVARNALIQVLETWKRGGTVGELRAQTPEIVVQEALWTGGAALTEYSLLDQGRVEDANLFCEAELTIQRPGTGKVEKKKVTYIVGTAPVITVFRAIL